MKIAIMSDSHDNWPNLERAIEIANLNSCKYLLHAGDLISPPGTEYLQKFKGKVIFVWGNNENEKTGITRKMDAIDNFELAGGYYEGEIDGVKIFMNHYPKYAELAAKSGEYDLVIHGHTHKYREESFSNTLLINPGEIQGMLSGSPIFALFDTKTKSVKKLVLE